MPRFTIHDLAATIDARAASGGEASYTRKLLDKGSEHCAKKLGEEAVETVIAAVENGPLCATQFHPEKSGDAGAALLANWLEMLR